ncbi:hypothetical protein [Pedobacter sp. ASV28]|uniref:hypothetical protein n=1 Tax=Pedobacter sp. ASV28 TaxID=2795123 RepID=UPI0018EDCFEB|nr:hypothetical protein [Pedobacter sp. ASV28]
MTDKLIEVMVTRASNVYRLNICIFAIKTSNHFSQEKLSCKLLQIDTLNKKISSFQNCFQNSGSVAVHNSNHFVGELIEIGGFSKIFEESNQ